MARYKKQSNYHPSVLFSLRKQPEGGSLRDAVSAIPKDNFSTKPIYILVHGFNNHQGQAESSYEGMRSRQRKILVSSFEKVRGELRDTFWPGDAEWPGVVDFFDFLVYPYAVGTAKQAGVIFANFLNQLDVNEINFIGHSLGCRVILETIKNMDESGHSSKIGKVCLMAAAVPTFMLLPSGRLAKSIRVPKAILSLYSRSDPVLRFAFPPGQTAALDAEGAFPRALGSDHANIAGIQQLPIYNAKHGHYWGNDSDSTGSPKRIRSLLANTYIAEFFGWKSPLREFFERLIATKFSDYNSRDIPARKLGS